MTSVSWGVSAKTSARFGIPVSGLPFARRQLPENSQLEPDIKVANSPETIVKGEDTQLKVAVEELLKSWKSQVLFRQSLPLRKKNKSVSSTKPK